MIPEHLTQAKTDLVVAIQSWCREQKELWQQVPYLALQADGRGGWTDSYSRAYNWGLWTLSYQIGSYYCAFIDCETGDLIGDPKNFTPLFEERIHHLRLEELDAQAVVDSLKQAAQERSYYGADDTRRNDQRRAEEMEFLGLSLHEPYRRKVAIVVREEFG